MMNVTKGSLVQETRIIGERETGTVVDVFPYDDGDWVSVIWPWIEERVGVPGYAVNEPAEGLIVVGHLTSKGK